ncbi:MAG: imidazole glycerol phosphate synthase subunit HisH [Dehalococcoidia bacterium]|nr:imidazole glycerol phosphate synthase subunit HisH [Dehalococcoidia bacterium]
MLIVIDYGAGNLRSVTNAITSLGYHAKVTSNPADVLEAQAVILPGVGAGGDTMASLKKLGLAEAVCRYVAEDRPMFGVCIGLQVLFTGTEEGGWHDCLSIIPGRVKRLPAGLKIPHMGWNQVKQKGVHPLFKGIPDKANFYFVHSYCAQPEDKSVVVGETEYGVPFCSVIARGNLVATQFHPEKSGEYGLRMYRNFLDMAKVSPAKKSRQR